MSKNTSDMIEQLEKKALEIRKELTKDMIQSKTDTLYMETLKLIDNIDDNYEAWLLFANLGVEILKKADENGIFKPFSDNYGKITEFTRSYIEPPLIDLYQRELVSESIEDIKKTVQIEKNKTKGINPYGGYKNSPKIDCKVLVYVGFDYDIGICATTQTNLTSDNIKQKTVNLSQIFDKMTIDTQELGDDFNRALSVMKSRIKLRNYNVKEVILIENEN